MQYLIEITKEPYRFFTDVPGWDNTGGEYACKADIINAHGTVCKYNAECLLIGRSFETINKIKRGSKIIVDINDINTEPIIL